ncbi:MAG: hypothetical protein ABEK17_02040 [Candidatus Aenigmatarchaeota archaeon]
MAKKNVVSDWNGTIFKYPTDEEQNKRIANEMKDRSIPFHPFILWRLKQAKYQIEERLDQYKKGNAELSEVYEPFNELVINGLDLDFIYDTLDKFAEENSDKIDNNILEPIKNNKDKFETLGILSVSNDYSIEKILEESGYGGIFETIIANHLIGNLGEGKAEELTLDIYGEKVEVFEEEFLKERNCRKNNTVYLGDSEDDEPIAEILVPGNFIVPFFASYEYKNRMSNKYSATVPEDREDLENYLLKG